MNKNILVGALLTAFLPSISTASTFDCVWNGIETASNGTKFLSYRCTNKSQQNMVAFSNIRASFFRNGKKEFLSTQDRTFTVPPQKSFRIKFPVNGDTTAIQSDAIQMNYRLAHRAEPYFYTSAKVEPQNNSTKNNSTIPVELVGALVLAGIGIAGWKIRRKSTGIDWVDKYSETEQKILEPIYKVKLALRKLSKENLPLIEAQMVALFQEESFPNSNPFFEAGKHLSKLYFETLLETVTTFKDALNKVQLSTTFDLEVASSICSAVLDLLNAIPKTEIDEATLDSEANAYLQKHFYILALGQENIEGTIDQFRDYFYKSIFSKQAKLDYASLKQALQLHQILYGVLTYGSLLSSDSQISKMMDAEKDNQRLINNMVVYLQQFPVDDINESHSFIFNDLLQTILLLNTLIHSDDLKEIRLPEIETDNFSDLESLYWTKLQVMFNEKRDEKASSSGSIVTYQDNVPVLVKELEKREIQMREDYHDASHHPKDTMFSISILIPKVQNSDDVNRLFNRMHNAILKFEEMKVEDYQEAGDFLDLTSRVTDRLIDKCVELGFKEWEDDLTTLKTSIDFRLSSLERAREEMQRLQEEAAYKQMVQAQIDAYRSQTRAAQVQAKAASDLAKTKDREFWLDLTTGGKWRRR